MVIQIIATGIIVIILGQLIVKIIKDKTSLVRILLWLVFWGIALIVIWLPSRILDNLGEIFGVGRGIDVLVYLSVIFLFYNNLRINSKIEKLEANITKITREIAKSNS